MNRLNEETKQLLRLWAETYNTKAFIETDPIQFPHRFTRKEDIEVSAFLTAWIAYGRRPLILRKAEEMHSLMGASPYEWIINEGYKAIIPEKLCPGPRQTFYRFFTLSDFSILCASLREIYKEHGSLEWALAAGKNPNPVVKLQELFTDLKGIPVLGGTSACKRLAMLLRWLVRNDGIVDLGIWQEVIRPHELIIPLDTHVYRVSLEMGFTSRNVADLRTALEVTEVLREVFPDDPALGDFSLFGYGVNR
ncbi:MAG: TIGR02757 family protein [Tannerellaceae bacterium]|nr:TIGR02757 family protein [Tannerellaceae bacterium]